MRQEMECWLVQKSFMRANHKNDVYKSVKSYIRTSKICTVYKTVLHTVGCLYSAFADLSSSGSRSIYIKINIVPDAQILQILQDAKHLYTCWHFSMPETTSDFTISHSRQQTSSNIFSRNLYFFPFSSARNKIVVVCMDHFYENQLNRFSQKNVHRIGEKRAFSSRSRTESKLFSDYKAQLLNCVTDLDFLCADQHSVHLRLYLG